MDFPLYFQKVMLLWQGSIVEIAYGFFRVFGPYFMGKSLAVPRDEDKAPSGASYCFMGCSQRAQMLCLSLNVDGLLTSP